MGIALRQDSDNPRLLEKIIIVHFNLLLQSVRRECKGSRNGSSDL
jgi:hypothetical protein